MATLLSDERQDEVGILKASTRSRSKTSRANIWRLLLAAAFIHIATTIAIFVAGRYLLLPQFFDLDGVASSFAPDSRLYMTEARLLVEELKQGRFGAWLAAPYPLHAKLYSLSFAALSWFFGYTILSAELLNLVCYLSIIVLVYRLGVDTFDARAGLFAAGVVALWPSYLLHSTQLLKDQFFIIAMLALVYAGVRLLSVHLTLPAGFRAGVAGGVAVVAIWLIRREMWQLAFASVVILALLVVACSLYEKRLRAGTAAGTAVLVLALCIPFAVRPYRNPNPDSPAGKAIQAKPETPECQRRLALAQLEGGHDRGFRSLRGRIVRSRVAATCAPSGSNIDADLQLNRDRDIALYLPRAFAIGMFAPFPGMWFSTGELVGLKGRMLSGGEMLVTYLIELAALLGLWFGRGRLTTWMLTLSVAVGITALGLAMPNIGTLYRLRYAFWMMLVVLAAGGVSQLLSARTHKGGTAGD
ncbi:MAG TPA: hypothetical protein VJU84_01165 [Pyrinomonadaceae bacterium]|nr:hypothetical protein [Pyrinomonadaceae bacterium]